MNSTDPSEQQHTRQYGAEYLAIMCPQSQAVREEGGYYCDQISSDAGVGIVFYRFIDLHTRPELAALIHENKSITTSDLLAIYIDYNLQLQLLSPSPLLERLMLRDCYKVLKL
jgi:hypothetical protein